ncbi:MAG: ribonuclease J [Eubacteriales bacterium]|nr:ribonuclease J [Eubacteriales bacterium]
MVKKQKLKIIPLGGLDEIGKNLTVFEYGNDIILIDCGMAFPDDEMLGVDLVIPDITYLVKNREKIRGIIITHGHEDHIGSLPYVLREISAPVYGSRFTLGLVASRLKEHGLAQKTKLKPVSGGNTIRLGEFRVEFIRSNHSIPDALMLAITTPVGTVLHTGDFKIDPTPIDGTMVDLARIGEIGRQGVLALMSDSTNAERPGYTMSESSVSVAFDEIFRSNVHRRIVVATFASNVHRVQQIINCAHQYGRKIAISGRSMLNVISIAIELGYMKVPRGTLIDLDEVSKYPPEKIVIITTGSQGETMSALTRMAFSDHRKITIGPGDTVLISASPIPGNEKSVFRVINELFKKGCDVIYESLADIHVSGHACQEELKVILGLVKPKFFIPIHGEYRHLMRHAALAERMGVHKKNVFIMDVGQVLELSADTARISGTVPSGKVLVDGLGVGDVGNIVLRDRKHLAEDGIIVVVVTISSDTKEIASGPDVISRGFVYMRESEDLIEQIKACAKKSLDNCRSKNISDWSSLKSNVKSDLGEFLFQKTKRNPMILPIIMEI